MRGDVSLISRLTSVDVQTEYLPLSCINVKNHFSYILAYCHDAHLGLHVSVWCYGCMCAPYDDVVVVVVIVAPPSQMK